MLLAFAVILGSILVYFTNRSGTKHASSQNTASSNTKLVVNNTEDFDKKLYSLTEPDSLWFINNKHTGLPLDYLPKDLIVPNVPLRLGSDAEQMKIRKIAQIDLEKLFADSMVAGLQMQFGSGFRSSSYQKTLYDSYVASQGQQAADKSSARPGYSEHQTGLTLDFTRIDGKCHLEDCFGQTAEGKWLADNAYKYGFILRYVPGKEPITGYMSEPWHYRYVGLGLAKQMHEQKIQTLEEFFGLEAAPDYL